MSEATQAAALPFLARLVQSGEDQTEAVEIAPGIHMSVDVSNSYLITTDAGNVLVNTGMNGQHHKERFDKVSTAPVRYIFLTQSHGDHFGGLPEMRTPETEVVAHKSFPERLAWVGRLEPYTASRRERLWGPVTATARPPAPRPVPDILVDDRAVFEVGGRRFETLHTPDGETLDALCVWMPDERIVFTGNTFGPVFLSMPFLVTLRGDRPRFVEDYLRSVARVRDLDAETLITGHGDPIVGAATVRAGLTKMYDAVSYVRDQTVAGMNAGKDVFTLMREIKLPPELQIGEFHGKTSWNVRSIWEGYVGWFYGNSVTEFYDVPRSAIDADLVELAGAERLLERAAAKLQSGAPLEALHLLEMVLDVEPGNRSALALSLDAHRRLLDTRRGDNHSEAMWLNAEIRALEKALAQTKPGD